MFKLVALTSAALVIFGASVRAAWSAEERFSYKCTALTGQFLYNHAKTDPKTTLGTSVFPLMAVLGQLALYSKGSTHDELLSVLGLKNDDEVRSVLPVALDKFTSHQTIRSTFDLKTLANSDNLYIDTFKQDFDELLGGKTRNINFKCPKRVASAINTWVKNHTTTDKGEDIICSDEIPNDSGLIFVSTHDILANWDNPFNPQGQKNIKFKVNKTEKIIIPGLYGNGYLKYAEIEELNCKVLEVPFKGDKYALALFLPKDAEGLLELMRHLQDPDVFYGAFARQVQRCLTVHVPFGAVNGVLDLGESLQQVHKTSIFDVTTAEFGGITKCQHSVYISSIKHEFHTIGNAYVDQNSSDTSDTPSSFCPDGCDMLFVKFDHPFAYYIIDISSKVPVAGGLYYKDR